MYQINSQQSQLILKLNKINTIQVNLNAIANNYPHLLGLSQQVQTSILHLFQFIIDNFINMMTTTRIPQKNTLNQNAILQYQKELQTILPDDIINHFVDLTKLDIQIFVHFLTQIPTIYIQFLTNEFFYRIEQMNSTTSDVNINLFNNYLIKQIEKEYIKYMETSPGMLYFELFGQLGDRILKLVQYFNQIFTFYYEQGGHLAQMQINQFKSHMQESKIMNQYLIVCMLQELSIRITKCIEELISSTIFDFNSDDVKFSFINFIIENFENIKLLNKSEKKKIFKTSTDLIEQMSDIQYVHLLIQREIKDFNKIRIIKVQHQIDLHHGILLENNSIRFIIHKNFQGRLVLINANFVNNRWCYQEILSHINDSSNDYESLEKQKRIIILEMSKKHDKIYQDFDDALNNVDIKSLIYQFESSKTFEEQLQFQENITKLNEANKDNHVFNPGNIGSTIGNCLVSINKYRDTKEFLSDFGENAAINGSLTYLIRTIPIIGQLLAVGGFGYLTYKIINNASANPDSKISQIGKLLIGTGTSIGSAASGALVGQLLIPIPVLGAFIGGVIGGVIGGTSSAAIFQYLNEQKSEEIVEELQKHQLSNGMWLCDIYIMELLCIKLEYFLSEIPNKLKKVKSNKDVWCTLVIFTFMSVYYSQKEGKGNIQQLERSSKWISCQQLELWLLLKQLEKVVTNIIKNL